MTPHPTYLFVENDDDVLLLCQALQGQGQVLVNLRGVLAVQRKRRHGQAICTTKPSEIIPLVIIN